MDIESCPRTTKYGSSCHEIVKAPRSDAASAWPTCASCRTGFLLRSTFFRSATEKMLTTRAPKLLLKRVEYKDRSLSQEILSCHPTDDVSTTNDGSFQFVRSHSPPQFSNLASAVYGKATVSRRYHHVVSGRYHHGEAL
jgi:hypothetical protein